MLAQTYLTIGCDFGCFPKGSTLLFLKMSSLILPPDNQTWKPFSGQGVRLGGESGDEMLETAVPAQPQEPDGPSNTWLMACPFPTTDPELTQKHVDGLKNHRDSLEFDRMQQAASDTIFKFRDIAASWMLRLDGTHCDCAAVLSEIDCHLMWLTSVATHVFFDVDDAQNAVAAVSMKHDEMREKAMPMIDKSREDDEDQVLCGN